MQGGQMKVRHLPDEVLIIVAAGEYPVGHLIRPYGRSSTFLQGGMKFILRNFGIVVFAEDVEVELAGNSQLLGGLDNGITHLRVELFIRANQRLICHRALALKIEVLGVDIGEYYGGMHAVVITRHFDSGNQVLRDGAVYTVNPHLPVDNRRFLFDL